MAPARPGGDRAGNAGSIAAPFRRDHREMVGAGAQALESCAVPII